MWDLLNSWLSAIDVTLFRIGNDRVGAFEAFGFLTGGACVWLAARQRIENFPIGIANNLFFLLVFALAGLWANAMLQGAFACLGVHGWRRWAQSERATTPETPTRAGARLIAGCVAFIAAGTLILVAPLDHAGDPSAFWDALTACTSLAAQWLLNNRRIETWLFWIAADCIYVPLFLNQGLMLTAAVYALLLFMCLIGLRDWQRAAASARETVGQAVA